MNRKSLLSLVLLGIATNMLAQSDHMESFRNMGIGVEYGLMGAGVQVAVPLVSDKLVLVAGYNVYSIGYDSWLNYDLNISASELNNSIERVNAEYIDLYNQAYPNQPINRIQTLPSELNVKASAKLSANTKILIEYYPSPVRSFHFTAGFMIGDKEMISLTGETSPDVQQRYDYALEVERLLMDKGLVARDNPVISGKLNYSINERTYSIKDRVAVDATFTSSRIKPYVGLGWGYAIPNHRVGFQFEIGAWYHGKLKLESSNEVGYMPEAESNETVDRIVQYSEQIPVFPQLTFRLTGRLF